MLWRDLFREGEHPAWLIALAAKFIGRRHQGATVRRIKGAMARVGSDDELGLGP